MASTGAQYNPDAAAEAQSLSDVVFLSTRDVSAQIPINFVTHTGVSITAACFAAHQIYDPDRASRCFSDLLDAGFERFILDLYWDTGTRAYNLCPVQLPTHRRHNVPVSSNTASAIFSSPSVNSSRVASVAVSSSRTATASSAGVPITAASTGSGEPIFQLGRYRCASSLNFSWVLSLLSSYILQTEDGFRNNVLLLDINLHAASPFDNPDGPGQTPSLSELPAPPQYISALVSKYLEDLVYNPDMLRIDRSDLNLSWFGDNVPKDRYPITDYFHLETMANGDLSTSDGWPNVNYLLISNSQRLLVGWGHVDPQMRGYNLRADAGMIFPPGTFSTPTAVVSNDAGTLTSGCLYRDGITTPVGANSSWATAQTAGSSALISNITACGIAPVLNASLDASTVDDDLTPYERFALAGVWNWAPGEPKNSSSSLTTANDSDTHFRCALLDPTPDYKGHWRVEDCQKKYPVACRVDNQPYGWEVSSEHVAFETSPNVCAGNATFDVPRTALENTYLYHKITAGSSSTDDTKGVSGVWIDFNSLDVQTCWVRGPNTTCPYYEDPETQRQRAILVPTIGSLIVLILTALTMFVKCNNNRRNSRRVRKDGPVWYDGIPA